MHNISLCYTLTHNISLCYTLTHNISLCYTLTHNISLCYALKHNISYDSVDESITMTTSEPIKGKFCLSQAPLTRTTLVLHWYITPFWNHNDPTAENLLHYFLARRPNSPSAGASHGHKTLWYAMNCIKRLTKNTFRPWKKKSSDLLGLFFWIRLTREYAVNGTT